MLGEFTRRRSGLPLYQGMFSAPDDLFDGEQRNDEHEEPR
jgi:hypothetical protein